MHENKLCANSITTKTFNKLMRLRILLLLASIMKTSPQLQRSGKNITHAHNHITEAGTAKDSCLSLVRHHAMPSKSVRPMGDVTGKIQLCAKCAKALKRFCTVKLCKQGCWQPRKHRSEAATLQLPNLGRWLNYKHFYITIF